jgi:predicted metal-dependent phosphoesterase TrpH
MKHRSDIHKIWEAPAIVERFQTAVSLHSHTAESIETLGFLPRIAHSNPFLSAMVRRLERRYEALHGRRLDYSRAYWTPPLSANRAYRVEKSQIEDELGLKSLVSITDHDTIRACSTLRSIYRLEDIPTSLEWSVRFGSAVFHLGVHNLPSEDAPEIALRLNRITCDHDEKSIAGALAGLDAIDQVLIVLNHPFFDLAYHGKSEHERILLDFISTFGRWLHAVELNGLRSAGENRLARQLAASFNLPVVSGGDRHGREPNANLNLTNAKTWNDFVGEIRRGRMSRVLFMPQYREPLPVRLLESVGHAIDDYPHCPGRERWSDRVHFRDDHGQPEKLSNLWTEGAPRLVRSSLRLFGFLTSERFRPAFRFALAGKEAVL